MDVKLMSVTDLVVELESRCLASALVLLLPLDGEPTRSNVMKSLTGDLIRQVGLITILEQYHRDYRRDVITGL